MTATSRLRKAQDILNVVQRELRRAIALEAMYSRCAAAPDLLGATERSTEGPGFLLVRDAIYRDLIVTLMGLVERGQDRTACLGTLFQILADPRVMEELRRNPSAHKDAEALVAGGRQAYSALDVETTTKGLRTLRDKAIVHVERGEVKHGAELGDARKVLRHILAIVQQLGHALRREDFSLPTQQERWAAHANAFWSHVARR